MNAATIVRDYAPIALAARAGATGDRAARMKACIDLLWDRFGGPGSGRGVSWVGIYSRVPDRDEMVLEYRRDKPACSPIGLYGMCGKSHLERRTVVVRDVRSLGEGYIACDPRDLSELVIPLFGEDGSCWGVLDVDSHDVGAFTTADADPIRRLAEGCGLSMPGFEAGPAIEI